MMIEKEIIGGHMGSRYWYYFLMLRRAYQQYENHVKIEISMNDIVNLFYCTQRNAKIILNKLMEKNLIEFTPGRGRGNRSTILFLQHFNECLRKRIEKLLNENEINKAMELVKEFGGGTDVEDYFIKRITHFFGYNKIQTNQDELELLRFPIFRPITTVDPSQIFFDFDAHLVTQVFNTLVTYNASSDSFEGCLAHAWESNEDKTQWLFFLYKQVKFHNGKEFTAEDVQKNIQRLEQSPHKWLVEDIIEVELKSKYSLLIKLKNPNHLFLHFVSYSPMSIVDTSKSYEGFAQYPIGTGPFKFEKIQSNVCELIAYDAYFQSRPHLDKVEIIKMSENLKESLGDWGKIVMDTGEIEIPHHSNLKATQAVFSGTNILSLNTRKGPLQNEKFREYICQIIDREELTKLGDPRLRPAYGFILYGQECKESERKSLYSNKEFLKTMGYHGESLRLTTYERHVLDAKLIQKTFNEYGIHLDIKIEDWSTIQKGEHVSQTDIFLYEGTPNEGIVSVFDLLFYQEGFIYPLLTDELKLKIKAYVKRITSQDNSYKRLLKYFELENFLISKGIVIFLIHKKVDVSYDLTLEGVSINPRMWIDFDKLWYKNETL